MERSTPTELPAANERRVALLEIFGVFFQLGLFSFGGGLSGWVYREVVTRRNWVAEPDFMSGLALSQIMPGTNIANLSVYVGLRLRGIAGVVVALSALLSAPFAAIILLLLVYDHVSGLPRLAAAMSGITAAAMGLLLVVSARSAWRLRSDFVGIAAMVLTFVAVGVLQWPVLPVVACIAPLSIGAAWFGSRRDAH